MQKLTCGPPGGCCPFNTVNKNPGKARRCPKWVDTVEKVFWGWRTKFSKAADAFRTQPCEGPCRISEKRPRTFVSALRRISTTELSKNQHLRDFWRRSIFDFFNSIDPNRSAPGSWQRIGGESPPRGRPSQPPRPRVMRGVPRGPT